MRAKIPAPTFTLPLALSKTVSLVYIQSFLGRLSMRRIVDEKMLNKRTNVFKIRILDLYNFRTVESIELSTMPALTFTPTLALSKTGSLFQNSKLSIL